MILVFIGVCWLQSTIGILQYFNLVSYRNEVYKVIGTFQSPNFLASFLSFGMVASFWLVLNQKNKKIKNIVLLGFFPVIFALILANSRTGLLMSVAGSLFLTFTQETFKKWFSNLQFFKKGILISTFCILIGLGVNYLYHYKKDSSQGRILAATITLNEIAKKPFLGHGFFDYTGGYNNAKANYFSEKDRSWDEIKNANYIKSPFNDYLYYWYEYGGIWCLLCLFFFIYYFYKNYNPKDQLWKLGTSLIIMFLIGISFLTLSDKPAFFSILLIGLAMISKKENSEKKSPKINPLIICLLGLIILVSATKDIYNRIRIQKISTDLKNGSEEYSTDTIKKTFEKVYDYGRLEFMFGAILWEQGNEKEALKVMKEAFEKIKLPRYGQNIGHKLIEFGNYKEAEKLLKFNIYNEPFRFKPRKNLLDFYIKIGDKKSADKIAKNMTTLPIKIPSKEVDYLKNYAQSYLNKKKYDHFSIKGNITGNIKIKSAFIGRTMNYRMYIPNSKHLTGKIPSLYLVDGQTYVNSSVFMEKIDQLIESKKIKPLYLIFADPRDTMNYSTNHRNEYYWCNKKYVDYFTRELIPEIEDNYAVSSKAKDRGIMGHSFGGLFASYLGFEAHFLFKNIIMQSPAFKGCPNIYDYYNNSNKMDLKMYLSYGTGKDTENQDLPMIEILQDKNYDLKINEVKDGNHDWNTWMDQIEEIMIHFYSSKTFRN